MTDTTKQIPKPCAWAMRIPGCDGSADWVEIGEQEPAPCPPAASLPMALRLSDLLGQVAEGEEDGRGPKPCG